MRENELLVISNYEKAMKKCKTKDMVNKLYRQARVWTRFHVHFEFACTQDEAHEINAKFKEIRIKKLHELGYRTFGEVISSGTIFLDGVEYGSIVSLYETVAKLAGYRITDKTRFNCTKIRVPENVRENVYKWYKERGCEEWEVNMGWLNGGPKADSTLPDDTVVIEEGFCYEET